VISCGKIFKYFPENQLTTAGDSIELSLSERG